MKTYSYFIAFLCLGVSMLNLFAGQPVMGAILLFLGIINFIVAEAKSE